MPGDRRGRVLAIGPANYAGQAHEWARAARSHLGIPAHSFAYSRSLRPGAAALSFPVDKRLPHHRLTPAFVKRLFAAHLLRPGDHLALDGFLRLLARADAPGLPDDLSWLRLRDLSAALIAHGSDVRDPSAHAKRSKSSFFHEVPGEWRAELARRAAHNRRIANDSGLPLFVSTPDLRLDLPSSTWLPLTIDATRWQPAAPALQRSRPLVLHVPSQRNPPIKGTRHIDAILTQLDAQGRIKYASPMRLDRVRLRAAVLSCDILIDQIQTGSYGVAAVEGMAAGRVVVGHVEPAVSRLMEEAPPILNATPSTLAATMERILAEPTWAQSAADRGQSYVARWHDGRAAAAALAPFALEIADGQPEEGTPYEDS